MATTDNQNFMPDGIDQSQTVIVPEVPGKEMSDGIAKKVHILTPDLSTKDAGKYMTALKAAINVYYPNRQQLYDMYAYVLSLDSYLSGLIQKRQTKVLNKKLVYKVGDKKVDEMDAFLSSEKLRMTLKYWLDCQQWGLGGLEHPVNPVYDFIEIPRKHIKPKWGRITYEQAGIDGVDYRELRNVMVVDNGHLGLLQTCALAACYKKDALGDWAELIEVFGRPTQVMWYEAFNPQIQREIDSVLKDAGSALRVKLPKGTEYKQYEVSGSNGTGDLQNKFIELMNKEMAVCQLGGTETTGTSKGSGHAQSAIHYEVEKEIMKADMDYLCDLLNSERFTEILRMYALPIKEGGRFEFDREVDIDFITEFSKIIETAHRISLPVSKKQVYEVLNLEIPENEDDVLKPAENKAEEPEEEKPEEEEQKPAAKGKKPALPKAQLYDNNRWGNLKQAIKDFFA